MFPNPFDVVLTEAGTKPRHRSDVDGLRAVAVSIVLLYHYDFALFSGGFVGVDVFFVISGFVITLMLTAKVNGGKFRFGEFYGRRVRRLVPAFLLVSAATFILISPFYLDEDYYAFSKSWMASLLGLSNLFFHLELSQYFAPEARTMPLLHTWSLAVEEQFYFLWPVIMLSLWRWRNHQSQLPLFLAVWIVALIGSIYLAERNHNAAYFLLPARVYEFLLGCGLALYGHRLPRPNAITAELTACLGLLLILGSAVFLHPTDHFPGYNALWPTLGATLVIYAGMGSEDAKLTRLVASKALVFVGAISYSIYLWHWPLYALLHYQLIDVSLWDKGLLIAGVLLLSWLTHRFVEMRFRYANWRFRNTMIGLIGVPLVTIWLVQVTIRTGDDLSFRIPPEKRALYKVLQQNNSGDVYKACFKNDPKHFDRSAACLFGNPSVETNAVLIGDSHATALVGFLDEILAEEDLNFLLVTQASTPFVSSAHAARAFPERPDRVERNLAIERYLSDAPQTVFLAARWDVYLGWPGFDEYFLGSFDWLTKQGHQVVIIEDVPGLPSSSFAYCLFKDREDCAVKRKDVEASWQKMDQLRRRVEAQFPDIEWIRPRSAICQGETCETVINGIPLYRDEHHLNLIGSRALGKVWREGQGDLSFLSKQESDSHQ